jgi:EmrB/QacA subfamily drug resistance transporter
VLLVACFGAFLAFLDATIVNVAFPSIRASFPGESIGSLSWVLNAYNIVFAAFLIVCGRLTDLLGRRRAFMGGIALFTVASALCGAAPTLDLLIAARVVQALGAAMLVPASLALVVEAFPGPKRSHAIGLWGATAAVAAGLGPPTGGALVELGGWRWAFLVNIPFGLAALLAGRSQLVESRAPGRRRMPDLVGAGLLAAALALLNLGIIKGSEWGWGSAAVVGSFAATAVLVVLFGLSSRRHRSPLLDPALLRIPSFSIASTATVVAGLGFYAYLLTNILWLQYVWGYGVLRAGLALVPGALVAAVVASRLGPLADRYGYRPFVVPGALVWAGAYLWYHQQVGLVPAFWAEWLPGPGAQRHRRRRHPPAAGQRGPRCRPRRPVRHRVGRGVQRPPGRRRPGDRAAGRHPGRPDPGHCCRGLPRRLGAVDRGLPGRGAGRAAVGSAAPGARRRGGDRGCWRPCAPARLASSRRSRH